jgi:hypothetical protein
VRPALFNIIRAPVLEADLLIDYMTVRPQGNRAFLISDTIRRLKAADIWAKIDVRWTLAAHDAQAARLNWKAPASFALTEVNSPTFTANRGYAGNGSTSYLNTGWNPSTNGVRTQQNNSHVMNWTRDAYTSALLSDIGCYTSIGLLNGSRTGGTIKATFQSHANPVQVTSATAGMTVGVGRATNAQELYENGTSVATGSQSTSALPNATAFICALSFSGSPVQHTTRQQAAGGFGASLSTAEVAAYYAIELQYMRAVGAA